MNVKNKPVSYEYRGTEKYSTAGYEGLKGVFFWKAGEV